MSHRSLFRLIPLDLSYLYLRVILISMHILWVQRICGSLCLEISMSHIPIIHISVIRLSVMRQILGLGPLNV